MTRSALASTRQPRSVRDAAFNQNCSCCVACWRVLFSPLHSTRNGGVSTVNFKHGVGLSKRSEDRTKPERLVMKCGSLQKVSKCTEVLFLPCCTSVGKLQVSLLHRMTSGTVPSPERCETHGHQRQRGPAARVPTLSSFWTWYVATSHYSEFAEPFSPFEAAEYCRTQKMPDCCGLSSGRLCTIAL